MFALSPISGSLIIVVAVCISATTLMLFDNRDISADSV
jgi:hypothetical protein